ncbi:MAG: TIGR02186 family protein [Betaproteobacteria bacterium]|nr:TIGR02186 family protein [Betaproteobacteria bacterium]
MTRWPRCLLFVLGWMLQAPSWGEEPLVVAPATSQIDISTDFTGADVKAVGAMIGPGDVIIKVVGPQQEATLSRETKLGPFWVGGDTVKMAGAPSLLFLYATAPIASILPPAEQQKYALLLEGVPVRIEPQLTAHAADDWRKAFFRLKERQGYYHEDDRAIRVFGNRLFIADMRLPGDLQIGTYTVETLLVKSGKVVGHNVGNFRVRLSGIERWVWNAAHDHPWLFGSLFTLAAMVLGFVLNAIPYRRR